MLALENANSPVFFFFFQEIEEKFSEKTGADVYTMTKTSVLRSLYEDLEGVCSDNKVMRKELERYRQADNFNYFISYFKTIFTQYFFLL